VPQTIAMLERFDPALVVSDVFDLDRTAEAWARAKAGCAGKVLIRPGLVDE
jgi:hypothetical protein